MSDCFISVDVETSGPTPGAHAMLSIGAVPLDNMPNTFYVELRPDRTRVEPETVAVHGLTLERLEIEGVPAEQEMRQFEDWVLAAAAGRRPVFVAYNAPFDWMFVGAYFHRYLGRNPFGHSALDMKAMYMGLTGAEWSTLQHSALATRYSVREDLVQNALADAVDQALLFKGMLEEASRRKHP